MFHCLFEYIHRRTIINRPMILHNNSVNSVIQFDIQVASAH